jgi:predicted transposase/invertase (TIGR01784 family)
MPLDIDPKNDYAFKKVFGSESEKPLLISLLNSVLEASIVEPVQQVEIRNPFSDLDVVDDKALILDIKAIDQSGRMYNIEMEMVPAWFFPKRILRYWSGMYREQLSKAEDFSELQPAFSISFVNRNRYPGKRYHWEFGLYAKDNPEVCFCPDIAVHVIELPKFLRKPGELKSDFERWCWFIRNGATLEPANLPESLRTPPIERAVEVLQMMTQSEKERLRYLDRERDIMAQNTYEADRATAERNLLEAQERLQKKEQELAETQKALHSDLLESLAFTLETKFGAAGKRFYGQVRKVADVEKLRTIQRSLFTAKSLDEIRPLLK